MPTFHWYFSSWPRGPGTGPLGPQPLASSSYWVGHESGSVCGAARTLGIYGISSFPATEQWEALLCRAAGLWLSQREGWYLSWAFSTGVRGKEEKPGLVAGKCRPRALPISMGLEKEREQGFLFRVSDNITVTVCRNIIDNQIGLGPWERVKAKGINSLQLWRERYQLARHHDNKRTRPTYSLSNEITMLQSNKV